MGNLLMHASIPITRAFFSGLLCFLFFSLFFFLVLPLLLFVMIMPFSLMPPTVHSYHPLYYLPWWDLPLLPLNCFWLLVGVLPRLPTSLPITQPLLLHWMCWLHHSSFPNKNGLSCLVLFSSKSVWAIFFQHII